MSALSFKDGEVVWVKWRSVWWPGEVWDSARVPKEVLTSLRKPVSIFVRFFQEEAFEYVRNLDNIEKYNCERKMDYIKKGMEKFKSNKKVMTNFPVDVQRAEELTKGNVDILKSFETPVKPKTAPAASPVAASPKTRVVETPTAVVASKKQLGQYNSTEKVQTSSSPAPKCDSKKFTCTMCHFSTDRMNLLMFHIKNHSSTFVTKVHDPPATVSSKKSFTKSPTKKSVAEDTIADDVRKIKESMKTEEKKPGRKPRDTSTSSPTPAPATTSSVGRGRWARREEKKPAVVEVEKKKKVAEVKVELPPAPAVVNNLKNEIWADWSDEDDNDDDLKKVEVKKEETTTTTTTAPKKSEPVVAAPSPSPSADETSTANNNSTRSSRSIRNIPKKQQRVSEVYVKPEEPTSSVKSEHTDKAEHNEPETKTKSDDEEMEVAQRKERVNNRQQRRSQQVKQTTESTADDDECKQPESTTATSDLHLLASANELLNETEVPKVDHDDAPRQSESTFHTSKSNDIEKRNLPPKERNKRAFRESPANNGTPAAAAAAPVDESSSHISEMKLPHKKKQSSRLISNDSKSPAVTEPSTTTPRRKRKSEVDIVSQSVPEDVEMVVESSESPLREEESASRRGQKRRITDDAEQQPLNSDEPSAKRIHADVDEAEPAAADNGDAAAIESPSKLLNKIPKNALKLPAERVVELKKQGLVTVGADKMNKLTEMGKQIYKEIELREKEKHEKTVEDVAVESVTATAAVAAPNNSQDDVDEVAKEAEESTAMTNNDSQNISTNSIDSTRCDDDVEMAEEVSERTEDASDAAAAPADEKSVPLQIEVDDNVNNNADKLSNDSKVETAHGTLEKQPEDVDEKLNNNTNVITEEKASIESTLLPSEPSHEDEAAAATGPTENGKEAERDETGEDETNGDGAGLIALQAETFGGPPNCFYLCRTVDNRYVPVNNQILVLNAQNALVPYDGDTDETISQTEIANESISSLPQLSPNDNVIINTPNGQKIELTAQMIVTLQQQADESGVATLDISGEQVELNINEILEALNCNQDSSDMMIVDNEPALVLESSLELPLEAHTTATVVSETLTKPIMSATIAPEISSVKAAIAESVANKSLEDSLATIGVTAPHRANVPKSLELPITVTNSTIAETVNHRKLANATALIGDVPVDESSLILATSAAVVAVVVDDNEAGE